MPSEGYEGIWGWADGYGTLFGVLATASNVIVGANPPYSLTDFFTMYPQFAGKPKTIGGSLINGSVNLTAVTPDIVGISTGQYISGPGIDSGTTIVSADSTTIVLSKPAIANALPGTWTVFVAPVVPTAVLNAYLYLASNSIFYGRWVEMWSLAMAAMIAHYATLWLQQQSGAGTPTGAQVAASGLAFGIDTAQSAGDVSYSSEILQFEGWGTLALTSYGQQLITWGQVIGSGNMLLW